MDNIQPPQMPPPSEPPQNDPQRNPTSRPSVEQIIGEVKGAVSKASSHEPYPWLAVAALGFTAVWLLWPEGDSIAGLKLKLWSTFVITSVLMVFMPMLRHLLKLDEFRAWQIAVAGASGMGFAWVAFLLPSIASNQAFFGTFATAAAALAAWTAPGKR